MLEHPLAGVRPDGLLEEQGGPAATGRARNPSAQTSLLRIAYYAQFFLGVMPIVIAMGSQVPELADYIRFGASSSTPTFNGHFPMVCACVSGRC